jgi:hypothetical protein
MPEQSGFALSNRWPLRNGVRLLIFFLIDIYRSVSSSVLGVAYIHSPLLRYMGTSIPIYLVVATCRYIDRSPRGDMPISTVCWYISPR